MVISSVAVSNGIIISYVTASKVIPTSTDFMQHFYTLLYRECIAMTAGYTDVPGVHSGMDMCIIMLTNL